MVYLGVTPDGGLVAVKVLRPEIADNPEFRRRFDREVTALMRVTGGRTVRFIEADTESDQPFMVTEYAEGPSLADYIDKYGSLNSGMLYDLATGLADALTVIHAAGIVHRDLKPSNVILAQDGPKVIDFGIAQTLDGMSLTKTGVMVGSPGFMAPEQITGHPGPAADSFVWGVTIGYAAVGHSPWGTGNTDAVLYRVMYADPDISAVPTALKPLVAAALAKDPQSRPAAHELLDRLNRMSVQSAPPSGRPRDIPAQPSLPAPNGALLLDPAPALTRPGDRGFSRRKGIIAVTAAAAVTVTAAAVLAAFVLHPGHTPATGQLAGSGGDPGTIQTATLPGYAGQTQRGVFQKLSRIVSSGDTMVTTGSQTNQGGTVARQQFRVSSDGGKTWRLAPVHLPDGGAPPLGYLAPLIAGGPNGWMAEGQDAIWTSPDGQSWTLSATHAITPREPGDVIDVVTSTADGFLAAGQGKTGDGGTEAVVWTSHDGLTWQRITVSQLGLTTSGKVAQNISYATSRGNDTVISDGTSVWLSTNGGSAWTPVKVPVDHGARSQISGVSFDGSGLIAVRPGTAASGTSDGVAYFSPNGHTWQYAGTIDPAGGWTPEVVKGSNDGFVVTGTTQNQRVAYTSTGTGADWRPTGSLGGVSSGSSLVPTVAPGGNVVAVGSTDGSAISQQAVLVEANTTGSVRSVPLASIPAITVKSTASADGEQIAVGSADGYPAIWRKASGGSWAMASSLSLVSGATGLAQLTDVTHGSAGWLAVGFPGPVILTSANGITWRPVSGSMTRDLADVVSIATAAGPAGYVIAGSELKSGGGCTADVYWSPNLTSWTEAHDVNLATGSFVVVGVAAGPDGFVSVGSRDRMPVVWTTTDGRAWTTRELPVTADVTAGQVNEVAINGNRVVATGTETTKAGTTPLAELSTSGGTGWQQVPFGSLGPDTTITALTQTSGGFTAASESGGSASGGSAVDMDAAVWTSATGASWAQSSVKGLTGGGSHEITTLAPSGSAVTGIDSVETDTGQEFVTAPLPGR